jgi:ABC transporter transmembrane region
MRVGQITDLPELSENNKTEGLSTEFEERWQAELARRDADPQYQPSLVKPLLKQHFWLWCFSGVLFLIQIALQFVPTVFIGRLLVWVVDPTEEYYLGWMYWLAFWGPSFVGSFLLTHSNIMSIRVGTRIRSALMAAIYRKSLSLSTNAKQQTTTGEVVNLVSNDSQRLLETFIFINWGIFAPFQIAGT